RRFNTALTQGEGIALGALAQREGVSRSYFTRLVRLSYLAPDITQAILDARHMMKWRVLSPSGRRRQSARARKIATTADIAVSSIINHSIEPLPESGSTPKTISIHSGHSAVATKRKTLSIAAPSSSRSRFRARPIAHLRRRT